MSIATSQAERPERRGFLGTASFRSDRLCSVTRNVSVWPPGDGYAEVAAFPRQAQLGCRCFRSIPVRHRAPNGYGRAGPDARRRPPCGDMQRSATQFKRRTRAPSRLGLPPCPVAKEATRVSENCAYSIRSPGLPFRTSTDRAEGLSRSDSDQSDRDKPVFASASGPSLQSRSGFLETGSGSRRTFRAEAGGVSVVCGRIRRDIAITTIVGEK